MRIVWLTRAQRELSAIRAYIAANNPQAAERMAAQIVEASLQLEQHPHMGRRGLIFDTREWVIYPYILIYRVRQDRIEVVRVIHGARRRL